MEPGDITVALGQWAAGDASALDRIAPVIYPRLREIAGAFFRGERPGHTWQATALVSELFLSWPGAGRRDLRIGCTFTMPVRGSCGRR